MVPTAPESQEAVDIGPELANSGIPSLQSRLPAKLPIASPVQETDHVIVAREAYQSAPTVITEYQFVEDPATTELLLRCQGPTGSDTARRSRWVPSGRAMDVMMLLLLR